MNFAEIMEMIKNPQAMQARMTELREKTEQKTGAALEILTDNGHVPTPTPTASPGCSLSPSA